MSIRTKILWILAVPFAGFLGLAGLKLVTDLVTWQTDLAAVELTVTESRVSELVHQLQLERGLSSGFLSSRGSQFAAELGAQRPKTDGARAAVDADHPGGDPTLKGLAELRGQVDTFAVTGAQAIDFYTKAIRGYFDELARSAASSTHPAIARELTAYYFFLNVKEFNGQLRATLNGGLSAGQFDPVAQRRLFTVLSARDQGQQNFDRFAPTADREAVAPVLADPAVARADDQVAQVLAAPPAGPFPVEAAGLFAAMTAKIEVMKKADDLLSARLRLTAEDDAAGALASVVGDLALSLVLVVLALVLAIRLSASIRHSLGCEPPEVASVARAIEAGVLEVPPAKKKSLGAYRDLRAMVEALRLKADTLEKVAAGDLTVEVPLASDQDRLGHSLARMVRQLREVIDQIHQSVEQLTSGAGQVAQASQTLAQGATQQASAVEQINASATEVASQAQRNAETARQASQEARKARTEASEGQARMAELLAQVGKMSAASAETQRIVKTIDDIAFQVNLLALNANVEAARAGKYGKGFGVVAEEVRNLAIRSAAAVKETTTMVEDILKSIEAVNDRAQATDGRLEAIAGGAVRVADILDEIATSSLHQAEALKQVRGGLDQIDGVTQANTASAEESASAAEELSGQAAELRRQVARFRVEA